MACFGSSTPLRLQFSSRVVLFFTLLSCSFPLVIIYNLDISVLFRSKIVSIPVCTEKCQQDKVICVLFPKRKDIISLTTSHSLSKINLPSYSWMDISICFICMWKCWYWLRKKAKHKQLVRISNSSSCLYGAPQWKETCFSRFYFI